MLYRSGMQVREAGRGKMEAGCEYTAYGECVCGKIRRYATEANADRLQNVLHVEDIPPGVTAKRHRTVPPNMCPVLPASILRAWRHEVRPSRFALHTCPRAVGGRPPPAEWSQLPGR